MADLHQSLTQKQAACTREVDATQASYGIQEGPQGLLNALRESSTVALMNMRHFTAAALLGVETIDIHERVLSLHPLAVGWKFFLSLRSALLQHSMVQVFSDLHGKCRLVRLAAMSHSYVQQG